jgi:hypothetical protein
MMFFCNPHRSDPERPSSRTRHELSRAVSSASLLVVLRSNRKSYGHDHAAGNPHVLAESAVGQHSGKNCRSSATKYPIVLGLFAINAKNYLALRYTGY